MALLSSPPWGPVQTASGAANGRLVVAARASDSETVNYSSKQRSHSAPWVIRASKTNTGESPVKPEHHTGRLSRASVGEFTGPPCEEAASSSPSPLSLAVGLPLWLSAWRNAQGFSSGSAKNGALQPGETRSDDRMDRNHVPCFVVAAVVYSRANYH